MQFDFMTGLSIFATVLGVASLLSSSRVGALKSLVEDLRREVGELRGKLSTVEAERDSHRRDADSLRLKVIEVLDENRALHQKADDANEQIITMKERLIEMQKSLIRGFTITN